MTDHVALIRISWPERALWDNVRSHWTKKAKAKKAYREEAWARALEQSIQRLNTTTPKLYFSFHPPDRRRRDLSNMPATQKASIDGIADALGCDDEGFRCVWPLTWGDPTPDGCVMIEVRA